MHRPLEGRVVSAVTEFVVEDHGSPQPSPGRVREGCLQAVALGEPGVTQVGWGRASGQGRGTGEASKWGWMPMRGVGGLSRSLDHPGATGWPWTSQGPQGPGQGSGEASWPQGQVLGP